MLYLRANKLFGEAGQHGEVQMPPWPSLAAGAIRSRMLADAGADISAFARGEPLGDAALRSALGTLAKPGAFRVCWFSLARRSTGTVEPLFTVPADVNSTEGQDAVAYLSPSPTPAKLASSAAVERLPLLRKAGIEKPQGGLWLNGEGFAAYALGQRLNKHAHTLKSVDLWRSDSRVGIALDPQKRSAAEGRIYTTEGLAPGRVDIRRSPFITEDVGFLVAVTGADGMVPKDGLLRLGGDGRGARIEACAVPVQWPEPDWERIAFERKFRILLVTPGLFERGWQIAGMRADGVTWQGPGGAVARLVCAAVPRAQVVSGWDLARRKPKAALRAAPPGSVYWLEAPDCDGKVLAEQLRKLAAEGFGCLSAYPDQARLAEGFNNVMVANWAASE